MSASIAIARRRLAPALAAAALAAPAAGQARLAVVATSPAPRALAAPVTSAITVEFDRAVDPESLATRTFWAFGRSSGVARGRLELGAGGRRVTLFPQRRFAAGESVMVIISSELRGADGTRLRRGGYSYQFWTRARGSGLDFEETGRFSTRSSPAVSTRPYGGLASDLDGDGFLDLAIVNEDTDDLRVWLNRGDRSGRFQPMRRPPARLGNTPSPSEAGDFDGDGLVDVAVANTRGDTVSILLGTGDGGFRRRQNVEVGFRPRGLAVLDADGDGDVDVAATSWAAGTVTVLANDGGGKFAPLTRFAGPEGTWALAAGDLDNDGVLDLVLGAREGGRIQVWGGNGDGTFSLLDDQAAGGEVWMLVLGDLDGDGAEDVAAVNGASDNAAILFGTGRGTLGPPRLHDTDPFPLASDLADLDGDGDLDWVTASFFGDWRIFANDGAGGLAAAGAIAATQAASCSLALDLDNDGALDLALFDELADEVIVLANPAEIFASAFERGDTRDWSRTRGPVRVVRPGLGGSGHALEVTAAGAAAFVQSRAPRAESSLEIDFELDPRRVGLDGGAIEILRLGAGLPHAVVELAPAGSRYAVRLRAREAAGWREIGSTPIRARGSTRLTVVWASASGPATADGFAALGKRGRRRASAADLANYGQEVESVWLGLLAGAPGAAGTLLFDAFRSRR